VIARESVTRRWKAAARRLKRESLTLYLAMRDSRTPWLARVVAALVVAYAFSPIDLIPDVVPVLGLLDDLLLLPLGIWLALRLIPPPVLAKARQTAEQREAEGRPTSRAGVILVVTLWVAALALTVSWIARVMAAP
jgi:uncharacterized membrane protein YkvA (DUF1232 family)